MLFLQSLAVPWWISFVVFVALFASILEKKKRKWLSVEASHAGSNQSLFAKKLCFFSLFFFAVGCKTITEETRSALWRYQSKNDDVVPYEKPKRQREREREGESE